MTTPTIDTADREDYGRRLLPNVIDKAAVRDPDHVVYSFTMTDDPADGFHRVTNRRYANGVNRVAWLLEEGFGKPGPGTFPSIGYIGPNDLRYAMLTVAAVKVGYTMMFLSPRNSIDGHLAVLDQCACTRWVLPTQRLGHVQRILEARPMAVVIDLPEQLDLLRPDAVPVYPYDRKSFSVARQEPLVILHTSGSTGLPKPVRVPHGSLATIDAQHLLSPVEGRGTHAQYFLEPRTAYSTFPNFHSAGMAFCFALPFFYKLSIVLGPALVPVNLGLVNAMLDHARVDGAFLAPSMLEQIAKDADDSLAQLGAKTSFVVVGGAPLNKECGDRINAVTTILNIMGVTEGSLFPVVQAEWPGPDWHYHHFHPAGGYTYQQRTDELFEQFQTRSTDPGRQLDLFQAFLQTFPDQDEVGTKDLYAKHPLLPDRWLYRGRADDVIVLSNGEKVNPIDMEACLASHPAVQAALVVGQGQFQVAAIVQLLRPVAQADDDNAEATATAAAAATTALRESLGPYIDRANRDAPAHGQLHRDYILFASDDKPFVLAGKDTVLRAMTDRLYEPEINALYAKKVVHADASPYIDLTDAATIQQTLRALLAEILGFCDASAATTTATSIADADDLFVAGLDSLSVIRVVAGLRASLEHGEHETSAVSSIGFVYANPTIEKLTRAVDCLVRPVQQHGAEKANETLANEDDEEEQQLMQELLDKFTCDLPSRPPPPPSVKQRHGTDACVVLTGSTGSLGSYLLDTLLAQQETVVRRVFCLNRSADARERQVRDGRLRGLKQLDDATQSSSPRVTFLHADLSKPRLGLGQAAYDEMLSEATCIIHNQWPVNFHLQLASFAPHLRGVRHLVDFALASRLHPQLFFVSSVGVVQAQATTDISVPEALVTDWSAAEAGYGRSKLVAERILAAASAESGVDCTICRLGQVAGPVGTPSGHWKRQEWLPLIIASSKHLGRLPSTLASLDRVDWLPVNYTAEIISELAGLSGGGDGDDDDDDEAASTDSNSKQKPRVYHVVNPLACSWSALVPTVREGLLGPDANIDIVPWAEWLAALEAGEVAGGHDYEQNPALRLLPFYRTITKASEAGRQLPVLQTTMSQQRSKTLRGLGPVSPAWMAQWMKQWAF